MTLVSDMHHPNAGLQQALLQIVGSNAHTAQAGIMGLDLPHDDCDPHKNKLKRNKRNAQNMSLVVVSGCTTLSLGGMPGWTR
jgi:hypothetical protein